MSRKKHGRKNVAQAKPATKVEVEKVETEEVVNSKQETTKFVTGCLIVVLSLVLVSACFFLDENVFSFAHKEPAKTSSGSQQSQVVEEWNEGSAGRCVYNVAFKATNEALELAEIEKCKEATIVYSDGEAKVEVKLGYDNVTYKERIIIGNEDEYVEPSEIEYQESVVETGEEYATIKSIKVNNVDVPVSFFEGNYEWLNKLEYIVPTITRYDNVLVYRISPRYELGGFDGVITDLEGNYIGDFVYEQDMSYENGELIIYSLANEKVCDDVCSTLGNNRCNIEAEDPYMRKITVDTVMGNMLEPEITTYQDMCISLGE